MAASHSESEIVACQHASLQIGLAGRNVSSVTSADGDSIRADTIITATSSGRRSEPGDATLPPGSK